MNKEISNRFIKLEADVAAIRDFLIRRAVSEAVAKGFATTNSPVIVSEEARSWIIHLADDLRSLYAKVGHHMTDGELMWEIERKYGDRLLSEVCIPHGLMAGACLVIALDVAKGKG